MIGATAVHYLLGQPRLALLTSAYLAVAAFVRVAVSALKQGMVVKAPKRNWKKADAKKA